MYASFTISTPQNSHYTSSIYDKELSLWAYWMRLLLYIGIEQGFLLHQVFSTGWFFKLLRNYRKCNHISFNKKSLNFHNRCRPTIRLIM